jgi:urease subunit alpha
LDNGITTLFAGGTGPADGTRSATATPGAWYIEKMLQSFEGLPMNIGILGKGVGDDPAVVEEQIKAGAAGIKIHEDWGATPAGINTTLTAADKYDVQVAIHTDSMNESGFVEHTIEAIAGRTIHTYHTEGAGGGHAPDIMVIAGHLNVLPSSTSPTNPYGTDTVAEEHDMLMVCHHLNPQSPEDVAFADSRIRKQTIAAEDVLQDIGALSMMSSDTMAMGRIGEVVMKTWQLADKMKKQRGPLEGDGEYDDNNRIKRYVAKYTINPAIVSGVRDYVGSIEVGKYADLVLWEPKMFGVKPMMILKCGMISYGIMGDASSSLPTTQPRSMRALFGAEGEALNKTHMTFVSTYAYEHGVKEKLNLERIVLPVRNLRNLTKKDMIFNTALPDIQVDPQTYNVTINGEVITCEPFKDFALTQRYFLY